MDHGLTFGAIDGFKDPRETLRTVLGGNPDGVLVSPHLVRQYDEEFDESNVSIAITGDVVAFSTNPGIDEHEDVWEPAFDLDFITEFEPAAVKIILVFGRNDRGMYCRNIRAVAEAFERLRNTDISLIVETVLWGRDTPEENRTDPEWLENAARLGWEYGADIIKIPYPNDRETFKRITSNSPVPVTVLGGKSGDTRDLLRMVSDSIEAGGSGIMIGRSIWQKEDPRAVISALSEVVHDGANVDDVWP
ncbi:fructose-1,6-bisphosphate aldolase [Halobacterium sp. KA-4]|uniref:class I fructose-bisphosphate aldolase n=1 Tax=Halobacterium sp. KA-4 TaxID=2896367 RepID=UPI001E63BB34|nr:fructose-1,6-bisphosphate aldolase [Halobacterium sp. KA-4]MCD2201457.1 fructose-1,6-bisphosphate aldolase [Halobacterium sp. KA-4]